MSNLNKEYFKTRQKLSRHEALNKGAFVRQPFTRKGFFAFCDKELAYRHLGIEALRTLCSLKAVQLYVKLNIRLAEKNASRQYCRLRCAQKLCLIVFH